MVEHEQDAPVRGTLSGNVHWELTDECAPHQPVRTICELEGDLAPLGWTKSAGRHCADDRGGGRGRMVMTAANGDALRATYTFVTLSETPTLMTLKMTGSFVDGGTGRFVRASGPFEVQVHVHPVSLPPTVDSIWPVDVVFEGRLSY